MLSSAHPWDDERVFYKIATSLAKRYDVVLCAVSDKDMFFEESIKVYGLKKVSRAHRFKNYPKIINIVKKENPEVIHFHDPDLLILGIYFKLIMRKKVIYDVHEDYPLAFKNRHYMPKLLRHIFSGVFNFFEKCVSKMFDAIVVVTEDIYNKFRHRNKVIIKNYPVLQMWERRNGYKLDGSINIIYIGSVSYERGISHLLEAVKDLLHLDIKLDIVGPFESQSYYERIKNYECDKIKIWGRVPKNQIPKILEKSHIGIVTLLPLERFKTSLPLKLFEYMAAGIPIIASNFDLWREIIEKADCGVMVNPEDTKEIKEAILYFYNNREKIVQKGLNGFEAVGSEYNWGHEEIKLFELYERILN